MRERWGRIGKWPGGRIQTQVPSFVVQNRRPIVLQLQKTIIDQRLKGSSRVDQPLALPQTLLPEVLKVDAAAPWVAVTQVQGCRRILDF